MKMSSATVAIAVMVTIPFWNGYPNNPKEVPAAEMFLGEMIYFGAPEIWEALGLCHPRWCEWQGLDRKCQERVERRRPCVDWDDLNKADPPLYMLIERLPL